MEGQKNNKKEDGEGPSSSAGVASLLNHMNINENENDCNDIVEDNMNMNDDDDNDVKKSEMMEKERLRAANNAIMMKTLVDEYRFSRYAVVKALDALGNDSDHDVMEVCNYILDNDLGQDCGGSVMPITNCPHIEQQAALQVTKTTTTTPPLSIFSMDGNNNNEKQIRSPVVVWDKVNVCTYWKDKKGSNEASSLRKCNDNDNDDDEDDNESGGCGGEGENW
eukprot:CAMPEP_0197823980 /NCGR_PEP_ID=MMETSP1437-20131217/1296_1 /TAXON_ID=49252 ORGANISM="Eucampia antarctica, Strain CCMP1452" /NCGR_SAMPLE_ID=MMETSP1437 /ASSEMBLY_ACC=CAM_ASM_001096 /LENGTH=221 /DNA_ID=CAMNT_0043423423 /DNA_START=92 /DNA_END=754 /DNA_ORIENTATION=+